MPVVFTDHAKYPNIADLTGDFDMPACNAANTVPTAYPPKDIAAWADQHAWARRGAGRSPVSKWRRKRRPRRAASTAYVITKIKCARQQQQR